MSNIDRNIGRIRCAKCSTQIYTSPDAVSYMREPVGIGTPIFCSLVCCNTYDPNVLTEGRISTLLAFMPTTETDLSKNHVHCRI